MDYAYDLKYMIILVITIQFIYVVSLLGNTGFVATTNLRMLRFLIVALSFSCLIISILISPSSEELCALVTAMSSVLFLFSVFTFGFGWYSVRHDSNDMSV